MAAQLSNKTVHLVLKLKFTLNKVQHLFFFALQAEFRHVITTKFQPTL